MGKLRPVVVLTDQALLDIGPPQIFVCPLSSRSDRAYQALHVFLPARDNLRVCSYALVEHCRSISIRRLQSDRLALLDSGEVKEILHRLLRLLGH